MGSAAGIILVGIDVGSTTVKVVAVDAASLDVLHSVYVLSLIHI